MFEGLKSCGDPACEKELFERLESLIAKCLKARCGRSNTRPFGGGFSLPDSL
jgi:hypothetical protein